MIKLMNICKSYKLPQGRKIVLDDVSIEFTKGNNIGILGLNGAGKSTLISIICGNERPDSGTVIRKARVSWPIGLGIGFHGSLTGRENLRFTARVYGKSLAEVIDYVEDFAELGPYMDMPIKTYSSGMRAKLAFGLSMAIGFDFYLVDEAHAVGDATFRQKSLAAFNERKKTSTLIIVSHSPSVIRENCDKAAILYEGHLYEYEDLDSAFKVYDEICKIKRGSIE